MTHSSPSSSARVVSPVGSEPAVSGSVIEKHERISPSSSGWSQRSCCSSVPCSARISILPVSGAAQLKTIGAAPFRPISSQSIPYSQLVSPGPKRSSGRNRFHSPSAFARSRSSTSISGYGTPGRTSASSASIASRSTGSTCSSMNSRTRSRRAATRSEGAKSMGGRLLPWASSLRGRPRRHAVDSTVMPKLLYEKRDRIAYLTINRLDANNATAPETHHLLWDAWEDFRDDDSLDVAILTGTGDAFCAGADLKTYIPPIIKGERSLREIVDVGFGGLTRGLHRISKPIIAAVNGWALAGGLETALACDIRIASDRAMFGSFEARRGYHHGDGGLVRLVNAAGVGVAMQMLLTAEPID